MQPIRIFIYFIQLDKCLKIDKNFILVLATRSPNRPNSIGFSVIKLKKVEGNILYVRGIDAFDKTPVLDIKPWLPSIDCPGGKINLGIEKEIGLKKKK